MATIRTVFIYGLQVSFHCVRLRREFWGPFVYGALHGEAPALQLKCLLFFLNGVPGGVPAPRRRQLEGELID
jgi:hypothetical protein